MAVWRIKPATSVFNPSGPGLLDVGGGTLTVDANAFLVSYAGGNGATLGDFTSVTNRGLIKAGDPLHYGLFAASATTTLTLNNAKTGAIFGGAGGVLLAQVANIANSGWIMGDLGVVNSASGDYTINNSGWIYGTKAAAMNLSGAGVHTITNSGYIIGDTAIDAEGAGSRVIFTNTAGYISGAVYFGDGADTLLLKSGAIYGGVGDPVATGGGDDSVTVGACFVQAPLVLGLGSDTLKQTGGMIGSVDLGAGVNSFIHSRGDTGAISGGAQSDTIAWSGGTAASMDMGAGDDTLMLSKGAITGVVAMGAGVDRLSMTGGEINGWVNFTAVDGMGDHFTISKGTIDGDVNFGNGNDVVTVNGGTISGIGGGDGADAITITKGYVRWIDFGQTDAVGDTLIMTGGVLDHGVVSGKGADRVALSGAARINGFIDLGAGADTVTGAAGHDFVRDGGGGDTVSLAGDDDDYYAVRTNLADPDGFDVIDGGAGKDSYYATAAPGAISVNLDDVAHAAINPLSAIGVGIGVDVITNFETVYGGDFGNVIYGSSAANFLGGGMGLDTLAGMGGADQLFGGDGADTFVYTATSDSGVTAATRDTIFDFATGTDKVDLSAIDANVTLFGDQAFTFIGANAFSKTPGELRETLISAADPSRAGVLMSGDVNGDGKADFSIMFAGYALVIGADVIL